MKSTINFGVIGVGVPDQNLGGHEVYNGIGEVHAHYVQRTPGARLIGGCGRSEANARRFGEKFGVPWTLDLDEFLANPELDAVAICTPSGTHGELAIRAARAGKHVVVEKPLEITTERVDAVIRACDEAGVKLAAVFPMRFSKGINALKEAIDGGEMGQIQTAIACCRRFREQPYYTGWRGTWALDGGGACMNQGIHLIDTLLYLLGDPAEVFAHTATLGHAIEVEDTATATVKFRSGTLAVLQCTTCAYPDFGTRLELHGMRGAAGLTGRAILFWNKADDPAFKPNPEEYREGEPGEEFPLHANVYADVVAALREEKPLRVDGREGRKAVALIEAIYESGRTGQPISFG